MNTIIIPAAIVAVIGLIAGIILTVASKLMYVPVDEKVAAISEALPGANCGACGFAGCDGYADALGSTPGMSTSMCPVGGSAVATKIAKILGVEAGDVAPKVAMVMCSGSFESTRQIMETQKIHFCNEAKTFFGGNWACSHGCLGMGDCALACKFDAITIENGVAKINRDKCVGCGACAKVCPNHTIEMVNKSNLVLVACKSKDTGVKTRKICSTGCIGCMKCQKVCKFDAIKVENNLASIDLSLCKNCGLCAKECPTGAIQNFRTPKKAVPNKSPQEVSPSTETPAAAVASSSASNTSDVPKSPIAS